MSLNECGGSKPWTILFILFIWSKTEDATGVLVVRHSDFEEYRRAAFRRFEGSRAASLLWQCSTWVICHSRAGGNPHSRNAGYPPHPITLAMQYLGYLSFPRRRESTHSRNAGYPPHAFAPAYAGLRGAGGGRFAGTVVTHPSPLAGR
jgi:hypothetical protein